MPQDTWHYVRMAEGVERGLTATPEQPDYRAAPLSTEGPEAALEVSIISPEESEERRLWATRCTPLAEMAARAADGRRAADTSLAEAGLRPGAEAAAQGRRQGPAITIPDAPGRGAKCAYTMYTKRGKQA
jgi:hypothetical protein